MRSPSGGFASVALTSPIAPRASAETSSADAGERHYRRSLLGLIWLAVTAFGSLMTLITVSLGEIAADLESSRATMTWAITALMLTMAVLTPMGGNLGDVHGHRRVLLLGLGGGAVATIACGLAWNPLSLIGFRVVFGVFAALVNPNAMSLLMHAYGPEKRATAVGWYQFAATGAPTLGILFGGPLIDVFGWRSVFFLFGGVNIVALLVGTRLIRPSPRSDGRAVDVPGAAMLGLAVLIGLLTITRAASRARNPEQAVLSDPWLWVGLAAMSGAAWLFVVVERRSSTPMIQLDYLRRRNFTLPMLSSAASQFAYMGGFVITPALLSDRYGWSVGAIALLMLPRPGVFSIASPLGGWLPSRIGMRAPIIIGAVTMMGAMALFAIAAPMSGAGGIAVILGGLVLTGFAAGVSQPASAALAVSAVDERDIGVANGMSGQLTFVGMVTGIQLMNVLIGDDATAARFATTYLIGLGVAALALLAGLGIARDA